MTHYMLSHGGVEAYKQFFTQMKLICNQLHVESQNSKDERLLNMRSHFEKASHALVKRLESETAEIASSDKPINRALTSCLDPTFDKEMTTWLKACSCLYLALGSTNGTLPENCSVILLQQSFEEDSFNGDSLNYLNQKCLRSQPNEPHYFGNLADAYAISMLFHRPMTWIYVPEQWEGGNELHDLK